MAWINASGRAAPTGGTAAHDSLRTVLGYTGAEIVEAACLRVPVERRMVGADGRIGDDAVRAELARALTAIIARLRQVPPADTADLPM